MVTGVLFDKVWDWQNFYFKLQSGNQLVGADEQIFLNSHISEYCCNLRGTILSLNLKSRLY